jgi:hypothetical protein
MVAVRREGEFCLFDLSDNPNQSRSARDFIALDRQIRKSLLEWQLPPHPPFGPDSQHFGVTAGQNKKTEHFYS